MMQVLTILPPEPINKRRIKHDKPPYIKYYVLNIRPLRQPKRKVDSPIDAESDYIPQREEYKGPFPGVGTGLLITRGIKDCRQEEEPRAVAVIAPLPSSESQRTP